MLGSPSRGEHASGQLLGGGAVATGGRGGKIHTQTGWSLAGEKSPRRQNHGWGPVLIRALHFTISLSHYLIKGSE